ncbi:hypothetical protein HDU97_009640 [Phlyctochytrium planicorne]|nr:hypothetical protein HDU97_009640 [Phlyctochytrium planicorne]
MFIKLDHTPPSLLLLSSLVVGLGVAASASLFVYFQRRSSSSRSKRSWTCIKYDICELIGNTPLVRIKSISDETGCDVYAKLEFFNIGGSLKDRLALRLMQRAKELQSELNKPVVIVEGTVGSTGISLATLAKAFGYGCHIVMPDDIAKEKYGILEQLGATVEKVRPVSFADPNHFVHVARRRAEEMTAEGNVIGIYCDQFDNPLNYEAHFTGTGPEIFEQTGTQLDAFVMGAGTGGTIAGISHFLKTKIPSLKVFLADPFGSGLFNKVKYGVMYSTTESEGNRRRHQVDTIVEGIGLNRITKNFAKALDVIDDAIKVTDLEVVEMAEKLLRSDGLFIGSSSAVNATAAFKVAKMLGPGHRILTIFCDHGSRHLTKFWNANHPQRESLKP